MNKKLQHTPVYQRKDKIFSLFIFLLFAIALFLLSVLKTIASDRRVPSYDSTIYDRSLRGAIISKDNYTLSASQKSYQAVIRAESIDPDKKALFVKLFSIYSGIAQEKILEKFFNRRGEKIRGNIILSKSINARSAMQLKDLAYKLRKLGVFRSIRTRKGIQVLYGLDIIENGETRYFPLKDVCSPVLGYVGDKRENDYIRPSGQKGLERAYDKHITSKKNGYFRGKRDVVGAVIHDKNSVNIERVDGLDLHLNIPLALQRRVELMIDQMKLSIEAQEILVAVMESKTGKLLALASSERYNPSHITQKDIPALNPKFSEYPYEAGSVMKPLAMSIALEHGYVTPDRWFNTYNGRMKIGKKRTVTDDHKYASLNATDIIVHSSNVGISQVSWTLTGQEFREGLVKFGVSKPSGIDLSRDLAGKLKPLRLLNHKMHRANSAYGYGMLVTFTQLLKAYSAFNNEGRAMTPRLVDYLADNKDNHYTLEPEIPDSQAVSAKTAEQIHTMLLEVVKRGTGVKAQYEGLEVGGKTGTAHIAKNGHYVREYHSSFYGFANDAHGHKYTIGALVIRAKKYRKYFASQSAVPTFKRTMDILVELEYLKPKDGIVAPSPEIELPSQNTQTSTTQPRKEHRRKSTSSSSVASLFSATPPPKKERVAKPTPKPPRKVVRPKVTKQKESIEDLF